ncbi:MAG: DUF937 domain-containing protein [Clostridia bacterium]|nr:DUF937 domain-containing protein [Clostridia bacterium]
MAGFDLNSIGELLANGGLSAIGKRVKMKKSDIAQVLSSGIPSMLAGMKTNASTDEGAKSLSKALESHSKDDISNIASFLGGADLKDGKKILGHIFGDGQKDIMSEISKATGVTKGKATSILALAAPLLLSSLGGQQQQAQQSGGFDLGGLLGGLLGGDQQQSAGLLGGLLGNAAAAEPEEQSGGLLDSLLNLFH